VNLKQLDMMAVIAALLAVFLHPTAVYATNERSYKHRFNQIEYENKSGRIIEVWHDRDLGDLGDVIVVEFEHGVKIGISQHSPDKFLQRPEIEVKQKEPNEYGPID
jgi:lysophospholipid acyltransferase (LPLAT)-like uncharacterized protein